MLSDGSGMPELLRAASKTFDQSETESILRYTISNAKPETAALAIAILAPELMEHPDVSALMIDTLGHKELGAAAALALSKTNDPNVQKQLSGLANRKNGLASQRAEIALSDETMAATLGVATAPAAPLNAAIALSILFLGPEIVRVWRGDTSFTIRLADFFNGFPSSCQK